MRTDGVHDGTVACDVAAKCAKSLGKRSLDDVDARHHAVPFGDAGAAWPVHANGMHFVEIGHRAIAFRYVADCCEWRDVAVHRIDALEDDQLRPTRRGARKQLFQMFHIAMAPDLAETAGGADAFNHRIVVERI